MTVKVLSDGNPDGTVVGQSASDKVHLYGGTPVAQRSSTALATSLLSASSNVSAAASVAAILTEMSAALIAIGAFRTTA